MRAVIYADPPYRDTADYKTNFDHDEYYDWCREKVKEGHIVLCSEYNMPDDFVVIYEKDLSSMGLKDSKRAKISDKLYIHKSQLEIYKTSFPDEDVV